MALKLGSDHTDGMIEEGAADNALRAAGLELLRRARRWLPESLDDAVLENSRLAIGVRPYPAEWGQPGRSAAWRARALRAGHP